MDRMISKVAREMAGQIYNPVTLIKGYVDLLERRLTASPSNHENVSLEALQSIIKEIQDNCRRAAGIAESLQDLTIQDGAEKLVLCTPEQIVSRVQILFSEKLKKLGVKLQVKHQIPDIEFSCQHLNIVQVMACLLDQAIDRVHNKTVKAIGISSLFLVTDENNGIIVFRVHDSGSTKLEIPRVDFCKTILSQFRGELELVNSTFGACLELRFPIEIK